MSWRRGWLRLAWDVLTDRFKSLFCNRRLVIKNFLLCELSYSLRSLLPQIVLVNNPLKKGSWSWWLFIGHQFWMTYKTLHQLKTILYQPQTNLKHVQIQKATKRVRNIKFYSILTRRAAPSSNYRLWILKTGMFYF